MVLTVCVCLSVCRYFAGQQSGLLRGFDYSRYGLKPGHTPLLPAKEEKREEAVTPPSNPLLAVHPHLAALSGLPMLDVLSMVRPGLTPADYLAGSQAAPAPAAAPAGKRPADGAPLDLSNMKRPRLDKAGFKELFGLKEEEARSDSVSPRPTAELAAVLHGSACTQKPCSTEAETVAAWGVDEVCAFVRSVDVCAEYAEVSFASLFLLISCLTRESVSCPLRCRYSDTRSACIESRLMLLLLLLHDGGSDRDWGCKDSTGSLWLSLPCSKCSSRAEHCLGRPARANQQSSPDAPPPIYNHQEQVLDWFSSAP